MNPYPIKSVCFDFFGVIVTEGHLVSNSLIHLLPESIQKSQVKSKYEDYNLGLISETEFWQALDIIDYAEIRSRLLNSLKTDTNLYTVINQLKTRYQLSILSNCPADWAQALSSRFECNKHFNPIIFSGLEGIKKPQPEIYQALVAKSHCRPGQIVFIDDQLQNLQAAHQQGLKTIYMKRDQENHEYTADYQIDTLLELLEILNNE